MQRLPSPQLHMYTFIAQLPSTTSLRQATTLRRPLSARAFALLTTFDVSVDGRCVRCEGAFNIVFTRQHRPTDCPLPDCPPDHPLSDLIFHEPQSRPEIWQSYECTNRYECTRPDRPTLVHLSAVSQIATALCETVVCYLYSFASIHSCNGMCH
jgi:hypothetical protein